MNFFEGVGNFFSRTWTALTGPDTPSYLTQKNWSKDPNTIPACAIISQRSNDSFIGGGIRKVTKGWSNHIKISTGGVGTIEAEASGIIPDNLRNSMDSKQQMIIFVKTDLTAEQSAKILGYLDGTLNKSYNYPAIVFNFLCGGDDNDNTTDFCSEEGVKAYLQIDEPTSDVAPEETSPQEMSFYIFTNGVARKWIVWDTYNINMEDVAKAMTKPVLMG